MNESSREMPERRKQRCRAISKKTGEQCSAYAVAGRDVCCGHAGLGKLGADPSVATAASAAARKRRAEERKHRAEGGYKERLRQEWEKYADQINSLRIKDAADPKTSPADRERIVQAVEARFYGRPKESVELEHGRKPSILEGMTIEEVNELWRASRPALREVAAESHGVDTG
jgi:hypothetical protein